MHLMNDRVLSLENPFISLQTEQSKRFSERVSYQNSFCTEQFQFQTHHRQKSNYHSLMEKQQQEKRSFSNLNFDSDHIKRNIQAVPSLQMTSTYLDQRNCDQCNKILIVDDQTFNIIALQLLLQT